MLAAREPVKLDVRYGRSKRNRPVFCSWAVRPPCVVVPSRRLPCCCRCGWVVVVVVCCQHATRRRLVSSVIRRASSSAGPPRLQQQEPQWRHHHDVLLISGAGAASPRRSWAAHNRLGSIDILASLVWQCAVLTPSDHLMTSQSTGARPYGLRSPYVCASAHNQYIRPSRTTRVSAHASDLWFFLPVLHATLWRPLLPYGYKSYKTSLPDWVKPYVTCNFLTSGHSDAQGLASECPDVKITNNGLIRSGTGCFVVVLIWQQ